MSTDNLELIASPRVTQQIMHKFGFKAKKSLGQNFLIDQNVLRKIVDAIGLAPYDGVIEIGPGIGSLTQELASKAHKVVAVELDRRLIPILREVMANYDNVTIVHDDILKIDLAQLIKTHFSGISKINIAANLPYYITTPIIMKLLEARLPLNYIVVMTQKEVAERITAKPGGKEYGSLSIAVQYYCEADIVMNVPQTVFIPRPSVDSAVIKLKLRPRPAVVVQDEAFFFKVVKSCFAQRRKTITNNLLAFIPQEAKRDLQIVLQQSGIDPSRRGETLTLQEFARLSNELASYLNSD